MELIGGRAKFLAGQLRHGLCHGDIKALGSVQARTHGGAAQGQFLQRRQAQFQQLPVPLQAGPPAGDFLGKGNGGGVLQMGPAGLDDARILLFQPCEGGGQHIDGGQDPVLDGGDGGNVHGRWEGIVGGLGHIDVVIGVQQLFSGNFVAPVGDDFVGVHVGLGAGASLPDHQREVLIQFP